MRRPTHPTQFPEDLFQRPPTWFELVGGSDDTRMGRYGLIPPQPARLGFAALTAEIGTTCEGGHIAGLTVPATMPIICSDMATSTRKSSGSHPTAEKLAAEKAEEAAKVLHSFAGTLSSLDALMQASRPPTPTPGNWWRLQAGRFKDDPTFPDFVARVQAAREREG